MVLINANDNLLFSVSIASSVSSDDGSTAPPITPKP